MEELILATLVRPQARKVVMTSNFYHYTVLKLLYQIKILPVCLIIPHLIRVKSYAIVQVTSNDKLSVAILAQLFP